MISSSVEKEFLFASFSKKSISIHVGLSTGGPSSSCEMIILRNKVVAKLFIEYVWEYFRPLLGIKNTVKFSIEIPHLTSTVHRFLSNHLLC